MLTAIGKLSKSFLLKIFVGIIILPFVFGVWVMYLEAESECDRFN